MNFFSKLILSILGSFSQHSILHLDTALNKCQCNDINKLHQSCYPNNIHHEKDITNIFTKVDRYTCKFYVNKYTFWNIKTPTVRHPLKSSKKLTLSCQVSWLLLPSQSSLSNLYWIFASPRPKPDWILWNFSKCISCFLSSSCLFSNSTFLSTHLC